MTIEALVIDQEGRVLLGPPEILGQKLALRSLREKAR